MREMAVHDSRNERSRWSETTVHDAAESAFTIGRRMHFGHLAGDAVLRQIADCMRKDLRQTDALYRYGGEEFLVLLPELSIGEAVRAMDRLRRNIELLAIRTAGEHVVTISVGVAELDVAHDASIDDWLRRTDASLYLAKHAGRNRVGVLTASSAPER